MTKAQIIHSAKNGGGKAVMAGVSISGAKEVLDFIWDAGLSQTYPILYDFIHLQFIDAAIMAFLATCGAWLARDR